MVATASREKSASYFPRRNFMASFHQFIGDFWGNILGKEHRAKRNYLMASENYTCGPDGPDWSNAAHFAEKGGDIKRAVLYYENAGDLDQAISLARRNRIFGEAMRLLRRQKKYLEAAELAEADGLLKKALSLYDMEGVYGENASSRFEGFKQAGLLAERNNMKEEAIEYYKKGVRFLKGIVYVNGEPVFVDGKFDATAYILSEKLDEMAKELEEKTRYKMTKTLEEIILMDVRVEVLK